MKKLVAAITGISAASSVLAENVTIDIPVPSILPSGAQNVGTLIGRTIGLVLAIAGIATFVFLVWGGIQWITSGGDKSAVEAAQHRIQAAILGLFIVFAAWAIMLLVGGFFGFSITNLIIPTLK